MGLNSADNNYKRKEFLLAWHFIICYYFNVGLYAYCLLPFSLLNCKHVLKEQHICASLSNLVINKLWMNHCILIQTSLVFTETFVECLTLYTLRPFVYFQTLEGKLCSNFHKLISLQIIWSQRSDTIIYIIGKTYLSGLWFAVWMSCTKEGYIMSNKYFSFKRNSNKNTLYHKLSSSLNYKLFLCKTVKSIYLFLK